MIGWILSLFGFSPEIPKTHSVEFGQPLTPWELQFMIAHRGQTCPDCETGQLYFIAEACGMMNVRCGQCHAKYNVADTVEGGNIPYHGSRMEVGVKNFNPSTYRG